MKKLINLLLSLALVFALTGCSKEHIATYSKTSVSGEIIMTDSITLKGKGDVLTEMTETFSFDLSKMDPEVLEELVTLYDETYDELADSAPASVTLTYGMEDTTYVATTVINVGTGNIKELCETGFIEIADSDTENVTMISFRKTAATYIADGYSLQE